MITTEIPVNEAKRIETLKKYDILDTPPDGNFDRITTLASTLFKVPIAIISLVDTDRIWFKSHYGLHINQIDREPGLCASAIFSKDVYIVENASKDPRTMTNSLVAGEFGLRFYAAVPLQTSDNFNLGTFCLLDKAPRIFSDEEKDILKQLAQIVMNEMELRLHLRNTVRTVRNLSGDITANLDKSIKGLNNTSGGDQREKVLSYLEASRMFLMNVQHQLDQI